MLICFCNVCVCVYVYFRILFRAFESFIVTPNLTQRDKMLPLALLFSAFVSFRLVFFTFMWLQEGRKGFMVVTAEL